MRLDERGVAWIDRTSPKVIEVAQDMIAHGWSPEEIPFQHPHLSMAQIHAALAHYYDNLLKPAYRKHYRIPDAV